MDIQSQWLNQIPYGEALCLQKQVARQVQESGRGQVLGLEHPCVLTLGVRGNQEKDIIAAPGMEIHKIQRGGEATIHNPGQLIIYPILPLKKWSMGVREYVEKLMLATEKFFLKYGVATQRRKEPGLYTDKGKIAFFGIQVREGITQHGLSINIDNDLGVFERISVCGVRGESLDRLANYKSDEFHLPLLFKQWCDCFEELQGGDEAVFTSVAPWAKENSKPEDRPLNC